jgi:hypothetical protein
MSCRASLTSPTLGVALKRWSRHHRLLTDDLVHRLTITDGVAEPVLEERRDLGPMRECLITSLRFVIGYACWLIDSRIALDETAFAFDAPLHSDVYTVFNVDQCENLPDTINTGKPMRVRNPDTRDGLADYGLRWVQPHFECGAFDQSPILEAPARTRSSGARHLLGRRSPVGEAAFAFMADYAKTNIPYR